MFSDWLTDPVYRFNGFNITAGGLIVFAACATVGFALSGFLQSNLTTRLLGKIGLDQKFFAIVRFVISRILSRSGARAPSAPPASDRGVQFTLGILTRDDLP